MKRAVWCGLCLLVACSSKSDHPPVAPGDIDSGPVDQTNTGGRTGGKAGKGGGGAGGAAAIDPLAPQISFTMPMAADDPNSENVLVDSSVRVRCQVEQSTATGAAPVGKDSVKITLVNMADASKSISAPVTAISDDEFEAVFDLSPQANGPVTFQCTAKDTGTHTGKATLTTLLDHGPEIVLIKPTDKKNYALKTPFVIQFTVKPSPIADSDDKAEVKSVMLAVAGVDQEVSESTDTPGEYQTTIDFTDKIKFPVAPTSAQIEVSATNGRAPNAPTRQVTADVTIDGIGPRIVVQSPGNFTMQHGNVELVVEVTDPAGVMPDMLLATINTEPYMDWKVDGSTYRRTFETQKIDDKNELTQLTINLTAVDMVGNKTDPPVSHTIRLDNLPPLVSLDPPHIREYKTPNGSTVCSQPFDPVGMAVSDLDKGVPNSAYFRALVEDETNHSNGSKVDYYAGTNTSKVTMHTQALPDVPLLIDTNNDHICDEIYPKMNDKTHDALPPDKEPVKIMLSPVTPTGVSWFAKAGTGGAIDDPLCPSDPQGTDAAHAPGTVCPSCDMIRVVPGRPADKPPAVYAFQPSNTATAGEYTGQAWEIKGNTRGREGWICTAARAEDNIGNVGISAPLRFCYDDGDSSNGTPNCNTPPPSCTDGCTISDAQKFTSDPWKQQ